MKACRKVRIRRGQKEEPSDFHLDILRAQYSYRDRRWQDEQEN